MAHRIQVDIVATDKASRIFDNVRNSCSNMSYRIASGLNTSVNAIDGIDNALRTYNSSMYRFNRLAISAFKTVGEQIYDFTKDAINNFTELEQQHAKTMGAMATSYDKTAESQKKFLEDSEKLKQQAKTLGTYGPNGKGSLYTVSDVSYAQTALVKSGMSADDILNSDAVSSILKFAGGNDLDVDTATTFAVNLATVFNKPVEEWGKMLDMVTKAADISVIDVEDIMESVTYTGGIASGLGRDLEEVLGVISVMGQAGLRGRVAGTGLQAFFTRILSASELSDKQISNAPSEYVGNMYNAFVAESTNADGSFKNMDEVASLLDTAMGSLNDQEQAWFAKKLFGLYQMKAAYALTGAVDNENGTNMITDYINQIENESEGTNDIKYNLMLGSQYGKIESLKNVWEGIKTDIGDKLSPVVMAISDELFNFLDNNGNYNINWDKLREAIGESGGLIGEKYGEALGQAIEDIGNFGIDAGMIIKALIPEAGGILSGIVKLLNGDISGALDDFKTGLENTNIQIDDLPPELQGAATAARNVIAAFTALSGLNLATNVLQVFTSIASFLSKPIKAITSKITSAKASVTSASTTVNSTTVNIIAQVVDIIAQVVNVFGMSGGFPSSGGTPNGTPTLPSGGGWLPSGGGWLPSLLGGAGGLLLGGAGGLLGGGLLLGGAGKALGGLLLGAGSAAGAGAAGAGATGGAALTGKVTTLIKFGSKYFTAGQLAGHLAGTFLPGLVALASVPLLGSPGLLASKKTRASQGSDWLDRYTAEGNTDYNSIAINARVHDWLRDQQDYADDYSNGAIIVEREMTGRKAARDEMMSYYKSNEGMTQLYNMLNEQMAQNGKITEEFLTSVMQWTKDGYTYTGLNDDIKELLRVLYPSFDSEYKDSKNYSGRFNETAITNFLESATLTLGTLSANVGANVGNVGGIGGVATDMRNFISDFIGASKYLNDDNSIVSQLQPTLDAITGDTEVITGNTSDIVGKSDEIINNTDSLTNSVQSVIDGVNAAMAAVQQPIINVSVTTNVDKSGNATSSVNLDSLNRDVADQSSRYGSSKP